MVEAGSDHYSITTRLSPVVRGLWPSPEGGSGHGFSWFRIGESPSSGAVCGSEVTLAAPLMTAAADRRRISLAAPLKQPVGTLLFVCAAK